MTRINRSALLSVLINVVAATSPGGGVDLMARMVAQKLTDLGARAIVVNKPGGSGIIGFVFAARAARCRANS